MFLFHNPSYTDSLHLRLEFLMLTISTQMQYGTSVVSVVVRPTNILDSVLHLEILQAPWAIHCHSFAASS